MRILLVKPKPQLATIHALHRFQLLEPIELGYLAAVVPPGHDVRVLDLRFSRLPFVEFERTLRRFRPDLVGLTGYTHEAAIVKRLARGAKAFGATVVVGGHHATVAPDDFDIPDIDAIVRGEGCAPFAAIVRSVARGERLDGIEGVLTPGSIPADSLRGMPAFPDPAGMPPPRHDLWDARRYFSVWPAEEAKTFQRLFVPASMVRTSFGCRMHCTFCIVPKMFNGRHRPRPAASVADEIAALPTDHVYFCDDENFIDAGFAHELAGELEARNVKKRYFAWTRATTVNRHPDLFARWRALGLDAAFLGFEFPSDEQLRQSKKGSTVAENARAHDALRSHGIAVHAAFMLLPEFDEDDFAKLRAYVADMPPAQFSFTVCTPSPGTDDYEAMKPDIWTGIRGSRAYELHDCMHPLTPTRLPLREFSRLYAQQIREAGRRNPRRASRRPVHPVEMLRVIGAESAYASAYADLHRDYPRELWDGGGRRAD